MGVQSPRHRVVRVVPVLWITVLLAVCCAGTALAAASSSRSHVTTQLKLAGKWKGSYSGAFSGHFRLHWTQTNRNLKGTIKLSKPKGTYSITGSVRRGGRIKFGAVAVGATYKGTVHGTKMSGTWASPQGGGSWSAHKVS